ncbi:hypothetical protein ACP70R_038618 [Stipagrostis hirtigluma subsp. patula]
MASGSVVPEGESEGQGGGSATGDVRSANDEAGSNLSFTGRSHGQPPMRINFRVPSYTAFLDDGSRVEFEAKDHIIDVKDVDGYLMCNLLADLANKCKWGTCQDAEFWYWDIEKRCNKCGGYGHRETGNCPLNEPKKRKRKPQPKREPKRPKTVPADTISPGSLTRRIVNLVHRDDAGTSTSSISAKRLLVLSQDRGDDDVGTSK